MTDRQGAWNRSHLRVGDRLQVQAYKSDGSCYRWWTATVETVDDGELTLVTPAADLIDGVDGGIISENALRAFYWPGKWYSLLEAYTPSGELVEIYVNISSPIEIEGSLLRFTDHELDVSLRPPGEAVLVDEDEFQQAAVEYSYSEDFQRACYQAAREALDLANRWVPRGMPKDPA